MEAIKTLRGDDITTVIEALEAAANDYRNFVGTLGQHDPPEAQQKMLARADGWDQLARELAETNGHEVDRVKLVGINHWTDEEEVIGTYSFQGLVLEHKDAFAPLRLYDAASRKPVLVYEDRVWHRAGEDDAKASGNVYKQIFINPVAE